MKILWCITGGGYLLEESCKVIKEAALKHDITVAFSKAGREVARMYGFYKDVEEAADKVVLEEKQGYSTPIVGRLGYFDLVVVSPCTANTVAKVAYGIADSMASNIIAQALKWGTKVVVIPTDLKKEVGTRIPSGRKINIKCRDIDLKNAKSLGKIKGLKVISTPEHLRKIL